MLFAISRSESRVVYDALLRTFNKLATSYGHPNVKIISHAQDHSNSISNAFHDHSPDSNCVDCYAHMVRKTGEKVAFLRDSEYYDSVVYPQIVQMSKSATKEILMRLGNAAVAQWRKDGEDTYAKWFEDIYLADQWCGFYGTASGVPGIGRTNNPLEGVNKSVKDVVVRVLFVFNHQPSY